MKASPLLSALACSATLAMSPAWAQTAPAPQAAKPAASGANKTLPGGGGAGKGAVNTKLLTRDELRSCLKQEESVRKRLEAHETERAPLDAEKTAIATEREALRAERAELEALKVRSDSFSARAKAFTARVETWKKDVEAHNASKSDSGPAFEKRLASLNKEREEITREQTGLEAERKAIQETTATRVSDFNAKGQAFEARVQDWNARNSQWNETSAALEAERKRWVATCADRRYREEDETAIRKGK